MPLINPMPVLAAHQVEFGAWRNYNFPHACSLIGLGGTLEELGEVARCIVKMHQGIRGSREQWIDELTKEVGDVLIKVLDLAAGMNINLDRVNFTPSAPPDFDNDEHRDQYALSALLTATLGLLGASNPPAGIFVSPPPTPGHALVTVAMAVSDVAEVYGRNGTGCFLDRWASVQMRDWRRYPETGKPVGGFSPLDRPVWRV